MTPTEMEAEIGRLGREQTQQAVAIERLRKLLCNIAGDAAVQADPALVRPGFLDFRQRVRQNLARGGR